MQNELLHDSFSRVQQLVHSTVQGLNNDGLQFRPNNTGNSIAWLIWHLTRIQDDHIADAASREQVWLAEGWQGKFDLPFDAADTGFGHSSDDVQKVQLTAKQLTDYYDAVHAKTTDFIQSLKPSDYERIVDDSWNPPVTLAVRIVSILADDLQHAGQAA